MENIELYNNKPYYYINIAYFIRPIAKKLIELSKQIDKNANIEEKFTIYFNPLNNNIFIESNQFMPIANTIFTFRPNFVKEYSEDMYPILEFRGAKKDYVKLLTILGAKQLASKKSQGFKLGDLIKKKLEKEQESKR